MKVNIPKLLEDKEYCEVVFNNYLRIRVLREVEPESFGKYLNRAINNLEFANFILAEHDYSIKEKLPNKTFYDWCVIIYYYAIYHTALALTTKIGYESKSHLATITVVTLFYYHKDNILKKEEIEFIIENIHLEKEEIDFLLDSKNMRERACYGVDELFELLQAKDLQKQTVEFVNKIRTLLLEF
ncbi:MAG: hypothetical protein ABIB47_00510 [Candidatus Woesearchaeota archaeon]